jgi:hypothetical protein
MGRRILRSEVIGRGRVETDVSSERRGWEFVALEGCVRRD